MDYNSTQVHADILRYVREHPAGCHLSEPSRKFGAYSLSTVTQLIELGALQNTEGQLSYVRGLWECYFNSHYSFSMVEKIQCPECGHQVFELPPLDGEAVPA